jgi:two-component system, cell cycle sensor histidine kinase and response regulator CckA
VRNGSEHTGPDLRSLFHNEGAGQGNRLGIGDCIGIVKQSGGYIWVYSELAKGTVFKVYLPRVEREASHQPSLDPESTVQRGNETVLLAEDSESLREIACEYLESLGYTVLQTSCGTEALKRSDEYEGTIHLLLTDVVMPEMGGAELAEKIAIRRPGIRVLYSSGYTDDAIVRHGVLDPGVAFIQKPYRPKALARKIREVLDTSPEQTGSNMIPAHAHPSS